MLKKTPRELLVTSNVQVTLSYKMESLKISVRGNILLLFLFQLSIYIQTHQNYSYNALSRIKQ